MERPKFIPAAKGRVVLVLIIICCLDASFRELTTEMTHTKEEFHI